jgi:putative redox protein
MDKSKELTCTVKLVNDRLKFSGSVTGNVPVSIDYIPPFGDNSGYTSLELLLLSLSSCVGSSVLLFLRKMGKSIAGFEMKPTGFRRTEHPTGFSRIVLEMEIMSDNVSGSDVEKVIKLSEETYCPVWSMLKGNVDIEIKYKINPCLVHSS